VNGLKLLHCADIHLDAPFTSLSACPDMPDTRRQELKLAFGRIVDIAEQEQVDLLLICGDLYEHDYVRRSTIRYVCDQLDRIPDIQVLAIPGNHDPLVQNSYYMSFEWPDNVHILTDENPVFNAGENKVCIYGKISDKQLIDESKINILMAHGTVDMNFNSNAFNHLSSRELDLFGLDYIALGHFHTKLQGIGAKGRIFNPGSPEPLGFDEEGEHGVFLASIEKNGSDSMVKADFKPINRRTYRNIEVILGDCATDEQAFEKVATAIVSPSDLYNMSINGTTAAGFRINADRLGSLLKDRAFFVKIKDGTRPDYDFDDIVKDPGLKGLFAREMLKRAAEAGDEGERQVIMQALYYGVEAIDQGEIAL